MERLKRKTFLSIVPALILVAVFFSARAETSFLDKLQWKTEKHFGNATVAEMEYTYGFIKDPLLTRYINNLGNSLAAKSHRTDIPYSFYIVDTDEVNAFAAPGGFVFVTRGLMEASDTEDELASVVGHEIGHVAAKHGAKQVKKMPLIIAGSLALANNTNETTQRIVGTVFSLMQLHYSREDEYQADTLGLEYAFNAGYDPEGMVSFFKKLEETSPTGDLGKMDVAFSSHPKTPNRISNAVSMEQMDENPENLMRIADSYADRFYLNEAVDKYKEVMEIDPQNAGAAEKIGQTLIQLGKNNEAREWFAVAEKLDPSIDTDKNEALVDKHTYDSKATTLASANFVDMNEVRNVSSSLSGKASSADGASSLYTKEFEKIDGVVSDIDDSLQKNWKAYSNLSKSFNPDVDPRASIMSQAIGNIEAVVSLTGDFTNLEKSLKNLSREHARAARESAWRLEHSKESGSEALVAAKDISSVMDNLMTSEEMAITNYSSAASAAKTSYLSSHNSVYEVSRTLDETEISNLSFLSYRLDPKLDEDTEELNAALELTKHARETLELQRMSLKRALLNFNGALLSNVEKEIYGKMLQRRFGVKTSDIDMLRSKGFGYGDILLLASRAKKENRSVSDSLESMDLESKNITYYFMQSENDSTGSILLLKLAESDLLALTRRRPLFSLEPEPALLAEQLVEHIADDPMLAEAARLIAAGEFATATTILNERGKSRPATAESHLILGMAQFGNDDYSNALENFKYSLKKDGKNATTHLLLANAFTTLKRFEDARNEYNAAAAYEPENSRVMASAAYSAAMEGELDEALEGYLKAAQDESYAHTDLYINIGLLYYREGYMEKAIEAFNNALKMEPDSEALAEMVAVLSST